MMPEAIRGHVIATQDGSIITGRKYEPVEPKSNLWLISVEVVCGHACHGFNIGRVHVQHLSIQRQARVQIIENVMNTRFPEEKHHVVCSLPHSVASR